VIPDEAVEAAARGIVASLPNDAEFEMHRTWATGYARAALEAAAPHLAADAWDEGALSGWNQSGEGWNSEYPDESTGKCSVDLSNNPYR
jgi:hypothetical protein